MFVSALALCDWSSLQKTRRSIARIYCSPRFSSLQYERVNDVGEEEIKPFLQELSKIPPGQHCDIKPILLRGCANMFSQYMCSTSFAYDDEGFQKVVRYFDEIFWEINQGYAVDFMPWLLPMYSNHMKKITHWAREIRQFILSRIIDVHRSTLDTNSPPRDFTDALLVHLVQDPHLNWQHIIFELEDFLGGHSAIGNLIMVTLAAIVKNPEVAKKIQEEIDGVTGGRRCVNLFDKRDMPYTEATILETLRTASSPIVPHVATTTTEIDGYEVSKGTIIFINNYQLNRDPALWDEPAQFKPERFLSNGKIIKPAHFIPFSTGKRTCIGQRLVQCFSFIMLASLLQYYNISTNETPKVHPGCVAVPPDSFKVVLTLRN